MRKKLIAALLACMLMMSCMLTVGAAGTDNAIRGTATAENGTITVTLYASGVHGAASGKFSVKYGGGLKLSDSRSTQTLSDINAKEEGIVRYTWTGTPVKEDVKLLTLTFTGAEVGYYTFQITEVKAYDAKYQAIPEAKDFDVSVRAACDGKNCPSAKFVDVDQKAWYHDSVDYVVVRGIMVGMSDTVFAPSKPMTRGMLVKVLGAMEGIDVKQYATSSFTDVKPGVWYAPYVEWAYQNNLVRGYGTQRFGPNDPISREQTVTILYRYWQFKGNQWTVDASVFNTFQDAKRVSGWAVEALQWATAYNLMNGRSAGVLAPWDNCKRAEIAKLIMMFEALS